MIITLETQLAVVHQEVEHMRRKAACSGETADELRLVILEAIQATLMDCALRSKERNHEGP